MTLLIGLDAGTSAVKAIAVDARNGSVLASESAGLALSTPRPGWAEQSPEEIAAAAKDALRALAHSLGKKVGSVRGIGLTGQMHSAVALDEAHEVVRPAILWCDTRTTAECEEIVHTVGVEKLRDTVGNRALEGFTLPKLLWIRRREPEAYARVKHVMMPKDYVGLMLTGVIGTDDSDASGTLAFDVRGRHWSQEVLRALDVDPAIFPPSGSSSSLLGHLTPEISTELGLPANLPVARGAADNAAAAAGLGVLRKGRALVSIGTSGVVLAHRDACEIDPEMKLHAFCHAAAGKYYSMGVMLAAGGALRWYRDILCDGERIAAEVRGDDAYDIISEAASTAKIGAGGVVFLPYLMGERTPHADAYARACLIGATARTTKADISRAVLEGITFGLADSLDLMDASSIEEIRVTGGGARNPFWRKLMADVFGAPIVTTTSTEGAAYGAALLAAEVSGAFGSVEEAADALVHGAASVQPDRHASARYADVRAIYRRLYVDLKDRMRELAAVD